MMAQAIALAKRPHIVVSALRCSRLSQPLQVWTTPAASVLAAAIQLRGPEGPAGFRASSLAAGGV